MLMDESIYCSFTEEEFRVPSQWRQDEIETFHYSAGLIRLLRITEGLVVTIGEHFFNLKYISR